jgi:hypothetical protein
MEVSLLFVGCLWVSYLCFTAPQVTILVYRSN